MDNLIFILKGFFRNIHHINCFLDLQEFAWMVEQDLLNSIDMSFSDIDDSSIPPHVAETIQHENAIKVCHIFFHENSQILIQAMVQ